MFHLLTVIGARPQIIKAAALSRAIKKSFAGKIRETILHTGQHYDENMSRVFFAELGIPEPDHQLNVGSVSPVSQVALMMEGIEKIILREKPGALLVYGDTNSTLAGAVTAEKMNLPLIHVEAGLRSFEKTMPEEINRIITDRLSTLLFSPTKTGIENLFKEGIIHSQVSNATTDHPHVYHCGDIMYDNSLYFSDLAEKKNKFMTEHDLQPGKFFLATIHRQSNTDDPSQLRSLFSALMNAGKKQHRKVVVPLHPRTKKMLSDQEDLMLEISADENLILLPPVSFLEMIWLEKNAALVLTDSGGVQKEAFYFHKPCVILREETEWVELVECGAAILTGTNEKKIEKAIEELLGRKINYPQLFGDGHAAEFIGEKIISDLS
ncbi:MAG: UDP-N-acetylglucosamine 2-epimerase (non-hydrolyzing) [Bacteroidetes bacterium]|nr:UDP-N-acetylglucosamine 2-epimerase (non-hydrolyzing) [Bacteroidota bacterium]